MQETKATIVWLGYACNCSGSILLANIRAGALELEAPATLIGEESLTFQPRKAHDSEVWRSLPPIAHPQ